VSQDTLTLPEDSARQVLLVQAFDTAPESQGVWTAQDRAWATRLTRETVPAGTPPAQLLAERARHALQRLQPRHAGVATTLARRLGGPAWLLGAALLGVAVGLLMDAIGSSSASPAGATRVGDRLNLLGVGLGVGPVPRRGPAATPGSLAAAPQRYWPHGWLGGCGDPGQSDGVRRRLAGLQPQWLQATAAMTTRTRRPGAAWALALALGLSTAWPCAAWCWTTAPAGSTFLEPAGAGRAGQPAGANQLTGIAVPDISAGRHAHRP
jgi:hypothetical protein